ncbi:MAG: SPASM domain-containing protein [Oscillospiraceae bacterium]|nr:SPASM domain-containing protein [Oscillospiraceae bacterium]
MREDVKRGTMEDRIRKLYVEVSSRCNLQCKMCFRHSWVGERFGDLDPKMFKQLLEDTALNEAETVFFGGMGEPLVHPKLTEMVSLAAKADKKVELITNGTLLGRDTIQALLTAGISRIWVSIDELYENYDKIQIGSDFDLVRGNLETINTLRKGTNVRLGMTAVVMRDNIASLRRIRDFAERFQADDLNLSHMIPNRQEDIAQALWPMCDVAGIKAYTDGKSPVWRFEKVDESIEFPMFKFSERYKKELFPNEESLLEAELFSLKGKPVTRRINYCRFIEEGQSFVRWDGDVSPCMGLLHTADTYLGDHKRRIRHHSFGNVYRQSLEEIWNSEEYRNFRERVHEFYFSPCLFCGGCEQLKENETDCIGSPAPTCGGCLWGQGFAVCP